MTTDNTNTQTENDELAAMKAELAKLKAENAKLTAGKGNGISFRVSEKGAVSVYGMGRFPVTLYREQWERLTNDDNLSKLKAFIVENTAKLSTKPVKE